jgi:hypothetical protein
MTSTTDATAFSKTSWLLIDFVVRQSISGPSPANNPSESEILIQIQSDVMFEGIEKKRTRGRSEEEKKEEKKPGRLPSF